VKIGSVVFSTSSKSLIDLNSGSAMPPDTLAYAIKVKNTGTVLSTRVAVIDTLPLGVTVIAGTINGGGILNGRVITFTRFNLAVNDSSVLQYSVRIDSLIQSGVAAINTAHITANGVDQKLTATFTPVNQPLLKLTKSVDKSHAKPGDTLTYTVTYRNLGTSNATYVTVMDASPLNTTYIPESVKLNNVAISDAVVYSGGNITINVGVVTPGTVGTITFRVRIN